MKDNHYVFSNSKNLYASALNVCLQGYFTRVRAEVNSGQKYRFLWEMRPCVGWLRCGNKQVEVRGASYVRLFTGKKFFKENVYQNSRSLWHKIIRFRFVYCVVRLFSLTYEIIRTKIVYKNTLETVSDIIKEYHCDMSICYLPTIRTRGATHKVFVLLCQIYHSK